MCTAYTPTPTVSLLKFVDGINGICLANSCTSFFFYSITDLLLCLLHTSQLHNYSKIPFTRVFVHFFGKDILMYVL